MLNMFVGKEMGDTELQTFTKVKAPYNPIPAKASKWHTSTCNRTKPYEKVRHTGTSSAFGTFSLLLSDIAQSLSDEEISLMKLIIQTDQKVSKQLLDPLSYAGDLLRLLHSKNLVSEFNTAFLTSLLKEVKRNDLSRKVEEYVCCEVEIPEARIGTENGDDKIVMHEASESPDLFDGVDVDEDPPETSGSVDSHMSVDDDDDVQSSQDSVTDEEKISRLQKVSLY